MSCWGLSTQLSLVPVPWAVTAFITALQREVSLITAGSNIVYGSKDGYLEGGLMLCQFNWTTVVSSPPKPMTPQPYVLDQVYSTMYGFPPVEWASVQVESDRLPHNASGRSAWQLGIEVCRMGIWVRRLLLCRPTSLCGTFHTVKAS